MNIKPLLICLLLFPFFLFSQKKKVYGKVIDGTTGENLSFVRIHLVGSKTFLETDSLGSYIIESNNLTDSIRFYFPGYISVSFKISKNNSQEINCVLDQLTTETEEILVKPPDELPSARLHKKIIAHKKFNDRENLSAYEYELYSKIQVDVNNVDSTLTDKKLLRKFDFMMDYLDSNENGKTYLPLLLTESISQFYFKNNPKKKVEIMTASKITGIENTELSQFLGDMYLDINIYDNYVNIFGKSFVSPIADFSKIYYKYYLEDSTYLENNWCYKLKFIPKRSNELTFEGEMWVNDSTFAITKMTGIISPGANINYIQSLKFEHEFSLINKKTWILRSEKIMIDANIKKNKSLYGMFIHRNSSRKNFVINDGKPDDFYRTDYTVEILENAKERDDEYWKIHRHSPLQKQETGIIQMVDTLTKMPSFKNFKKLAYFGSTGYYQLNKIEIGNLATIFSVNPVEKYRFGLAIRSSYKFSRRIEIGGKIAYGILDEAFKYGVSFRANISPKKRGLLTTYYNYDIQQIGQSPNAATVGSTLGTLFRTGPLDKLTFVQKIGLNLEKDIKKDLILFGGYEWKEFTPLGIIHYLKFNENTFQNDTLKQIKTSEFTGRIRWTKDEEFIAGPFDRKTLVSKFPIFILQGIFGIKGMFGGNYSYQKIEFQIDHTHQLGVLGRIKYGVNAGQVFGSTAYPFLKVHETNQSYWLSSNTFNKMHFFEFISDRYVGGYVEQHFGGLFLNRIPLIKKLQWRFVSSGRITYGAISERNKKEMLLPSFTKQFGKTPYSEATIGIENIFKYGRIDLVCRLSHLNPEISPFGIRAKMTFYF
jgi:hypothetical protein